MVLKAEVTGVVLAGGRGTRMGGIDKGLQLLDGLPLAQHALQRLAPQVAAVMINANRHLDAYARFGVPVWPDEPADYAGPLAGFMAALSHCHTPWLVTVPCDSPRFPSDLVARLDAGRADAPAAIAVTVDGGTRQRHPVFCLMSRALQPDLADFIAQGGRKIDLWLSRHGCAEVVFEDVDAFFNANTADDLRQLQTP